MPRSRRWRWTRSSCWGGRDVSRRPAFSLVEALTACAIVGVLLVAALNAVTAMARGRVNLADRAQGSALAQRLMSEVVGQRYEDPTQANAGLGLETGERTTDRTDWDDVDDFNGLDQSPPRDRSGRVLTTEPGWRWTVSVQRVVLNDNGSVGAVSVTDTGCKKVVVTVQHRGTTVASETAYRTRGWDSGAP